MELPPKSVVRVWSVLSVTLYVTCRFGASLDSKPGCPPCRCEGTLYYCDNAGLDAFPHHLIANTTTISLTGLSLRHNHLLSVPEGALSRHTALQWLLLGHSRIQRLGERSFLGLRRLKELELSANHLRLLPNWTLRPLQNLRLLDLSSNRLSALSVGQFRGLRKLAALRLRGNRLASLPVRVFRDLRRLRHLDLGENQLQTLARNTFEGLIRLTELRLDQNRLSRINLGLFARLTSLHTLDLSQNLAAWLSRTLHWYWPTLEHLDLSQNQLEWLEPNAFHGVPHLKSLLLHSNRLQVLELGILNSWVSVENLTLSWNPWDCGPSVCALAAWLVYHRGRQWDNGPLLCALPHKAAGENILDAVHTFQTCQSRVFDFHTAETNTSSVAQVNNRIEMDTAVLTGIVATTTTETEWYFVTEMTGNGLNEKESGYI
ncbi:leucine-rich repeat transmembrane neuronal protein 1-like [Engraulis encrasicolus]|uniref:leucine-rich repeat transmembrane neuronal protein 1-like n=1 Tax=Engraulis encrasicolus TaxID=184585 RepID=UPI002FD524A2